MNEEQQRTALPVLALKNVVVFPKLVIPLSVGRDVSRAAVDAAIELHDGEILLLAQRDPEQESPAATDLNSAGTLARIRKVLRSSAHSIEIIVSGMERIHAVDLQMGDKYFHAVPVEWPLDIDDGEDREALQTALYELASKAIEKINPQAAEQIAGLLGSADDPAQVIALLATAFSMDLEKQQGLLEAPTLTEALKLAVKHVSHEIQVLEMRQKIISEAHSEISKEQRDYMLRRQMKAIQQELGEDDPEKAEVAELRKRLDETDLPEAALKEANRELGRLERLPSQSPERHVLRTWLDLVLELPWNTTTEDHLEIARARDILNEDHYGLDDVKERILEHLGVLQRNPDAKAPILCFVGPPGVGKTSLGQSIARALGRKFERMSVGGLHDEAELRGHRRTYIGSMPGKVLQSLSKVGTRNPLFLLDEIDKLGMDFRGDPSSALLEVLDPEQNHTFSDHYVEVDFDLSDVMFVATSNSMNIPPALLDRMEVIRLAGYTEDEKLNIAQRYLLPKQQKNNGVKDHEMDLTEGAIRGIIRYFTREAGVRSLEREISKICRKVVKGHQLKKYEGQVVVTADNLNDFLGVRKYDFGRTEKKNQIGQVVGLAWTEVGGDLLTIEATVMPGKGNIIRTGLLGDVMKESVEAARTVVRSRARRLGIKDEIFEKRDMHIHVPDGATPKDGPSAGAAMTTALVSALCGIPVRADVAMTGEITLRGEVTAIGGLKEKLLAAHRGGVKTVLIPEENVKDLQEIPENAKNNLEIVPVRWIDQVLAIALERVPEALADEEPAAAAPAAVAKAEAAAPALAADGLPH
ncbi:MAG: endopeptidase La [Rubrivivax sp.]|nr:endopeptidase La [Rubrivivax sp.]